MFGAPSQVCERCLSLVVGLTLWSSALVLGRWVIGLGCLVPVSNGADDTFTVVRWIFGLLVLTAGRGVSRRCEHCGSTALVPVTTPRGGRLLHESIQLGRKT